MLPQLKLLDIYSGFIRRIEISRMIERRHEAFAAKPGVLKARMVLLFLRGQAPSSSASWARLSRGADTEQGATSDEATAYPRHCGQIKPPVIKSDHRAVRTPEPRSSLSGRGDELLHRESIILAPSSCPGSSSSNHQKRVDRPTAWRPPA